MSLFTVITGHDQYEEFTLPCINSYRKHGGPWYAILDIDSAPVYPETASLFHINNNCLAQALNIGIAHAHLINVDWFMWLNNDTLVQAPFEYIVDTLEPDGVYSEAITERTDLSQERTIRFVSGGYFLFPMRLVSDVGNFDENFKPFLWEDVDYCMRAEDQGWKLKTVTLPIKHCKTESKFDKRRGQIYYKNLAYLLEKWDI